MTEPEIKLQKWLESRYTMLWDAFQDKEFDLDAAVKVLEKNADKKEEIPVYLSELRKAGWLEAKVDAKDSRKRRYTLISRKEIIVLFQRIEDS